MARLMSRFAKTPAAKKRLRLVTALLFGIVAALGWWTIAQEGSTPARLLTAAASTVVAVLEILVPGRRRLRPRAHDA